MPNAKINNIKIYYELRGNKESNEVIAFLNGSMTSIKNWEPYLPEYEKLGYKILLHDFKGQLLSGTPAGPYTYAEHAGEVKALFDALNIKNAHIIGTSYGGSVGMRLALDHPGYVKTLSLMSTLCGPNENFLSYLRILINLLEKIITKKDPVKKFMIQQFYQTLASLTYSKSFIRENKNMIDQRLDSFYKLPDAVFQGQIDILENAYTNLNFCEALSNITCPTLIIHGEKDVFVPLELGTMLYKKILNAEFLVIPEIAHGLFMEIPEKVLSPILGFIMKNSNFSF